MHGVVFPEMDSIAENAGERSDKTLRLASKMPELFTTIAVKTLSMTKQYFMDDPAHKVSILTDSAMIEAVLDKWTRLLDAPVEILHDFVETGESSVSEDLMHVTTSSCLHKNVFFI